MDCGSLNDPVNGSVVGPTSTFPSMVTYSCDEGFELEGEASRMCQANGKWTGSDPMCGKFVQDVVEVFQVAPSV